TVRRRSWRLGGLRCRRPPVSGARLDSHRPHVSDEGMSSDPLLIYYDPPAPLPTEYRVGLCAWQDKSMIEEGQFYPLKSLRAGERLWWYSQFFDCVEVNSTFYAPLSAENSVRWVKRTPPGFLFSVKAYALLTGHHIDAARLPEPLREMLPASARPNARGQIEN